MAIDLAGMTDEELAAKARAHLLTAQQSSRQRAAEYTLAYQCWVEACRRGKPGLYEQALDTVQAEAAAIRQSNAEALKKLKGG